MAMGSLTSCHTKEASKDIIQDNVDNAVAQLTLQTDIIEKSGKLTKVSQVNKYQLACL